jgi:hypothetical protein
VKVAVKKSAPSCSDVAARTSAQTSSGEKTWMSPEGRDDTFSTSVAAFSRRP